MFSTAVIGGLVVILTRKYAPKASMVYSVCAGVMAGSCLVFGMSLMEVVIGHPSGSYNEDALTWWGLVLMFALLQVSGTLLQIQYLSYAMSTGSTVLTTNIFCAVNVLYSLVISGVALQAFLDYTVLQWCMMSGGALLIIIGISVLYDEEPPLTSCDIVTQREAL